MFELPVTTLHAHLNPTVAFQQLDDLVNLHGARLYPIDLLLPIGIESSVTLEEGEMPLISILAPFRFFRYTRAVRVAAPKCNTIWRMLRFGYPCKSRALRRGTCLLQARGPSKIPPRSTPADT